MSELLLFKRAEGGIIDQVSVDETIAGPGDEETMIDGHKKLQKRLYNH
jgi:hypothetical protein